LYELFVVIQLFYIFVCFLLKCWPILPDTAVDFDSFKQSVIHGRIFVRKDYKTIASTKIYLIIVQKHVLFILFFLLKLSCIFIQNLNLFFLFYYEIYW